MRLLPLVHIAIVFVATLNGCSGGNKGGEGSPEKTQGPASSPSPKGTTPSEPKEEGSEEPKTDAPSTQAESPTQPILLTLQDPTLGTDCKVSFAGTVAESVPAGASFAATSGLSGASASANPSGFTFTLPFAANAGDYTAQWTLLDSLSGIMGEEKAFRLVPKM